MNESWLRFLEMQGATVASPGDEPSVTDFGAPAREAAAAVSGDAIAPLADFALVKVGGADADTFLQGQLTNDLATLGRDRHGLGAYCNVKGRVIATFRMFRRDEAWILAMPAAVVAAVVDKLRLYRVAARVEIERLESVVGIGIVGSDAVARVFERTGIERREPGRIASAGPVSLVVESRPRERIFAFGAIDALAGIWEVVADHATKCGRDGWSLLDVRGGIPFLVPATSEAFLPQMLGLERLDAVSFTKGCFPGQEVVARTQHLGRVKRLPRRGRIAGPVRLPDPGDPLRAISEGRESDAGTVIAAARDEEGRVELLAVVPQSAAEATAIRLRDRDGLPVELIG